MSRCLLNPVLRKSPPLSMTFSRAFSISKCLLANYYDVLKINPNASQKEIKAAYFKLSKQNHPDLNQNDPSCHDRFIKLQEAYKVLSNPSSRKEYDMRARVGGDKRQAYYHRDAQRNPEAYYHRDARRKSDFSTFDEWIKQQNERKEREMKYRYHDSQNFNAFYSRPHNMTPEEMKLFLRRKKITGKYHPIKFFVCCFFVYIFAIMYESFHQKKLQDNYYKYNALRNRQLSKGIRDPSYKEQSLEAETPLMNELEKAVAINTTQYDDD